MAKVKITGSYGMMALSALLILQGLSQLLSLSFQGLNVVMGALAIAAGVLLLIQK